MDQEREHPEQLDEREEPAPQVARTTAGDWLIVLDSSEDDGDTLIRYPAPGSPPSPARSS